MKPVREPASSRPKPCAFLKNVAGILPVRRSLLARRKQTDGRAGQRSVFFPSETSQFAPLILAQAGVQHPSGSSTIELPCALAESGVYSPDTACHCTVARAAAPYQAFHDRQWPLPLACHQQHHVLPKGTKLDLGRGALGEHHPQPTKPQPRLNRPTETRKQPISYISLEGEPSPTPIGKILPHSYYPKTRFRRNMARVIVISIDAAESSAHLARPRSNAVNLHNIPKSRPFTTSGSRGGKRSLAISFPFLTPPVRAGEFSRTRVQHSPGSAPTRPEPGLVFPLEDKLPNCKLQQYVVAQKYFLNSTVSTMLYSVVGV